jgi:ribosome biogenesis GTPase A
MRVRYDFSSRMTRRALAESSNQHRKAYPSLAKEVIRISDVVLEILDARYIDKTRNFDMETLIKQQNKILLIVLNKSDLADVSELKKNYDLKSIEPYVFFSARTKLGHKRLRDLIKILVKRHKLKDKHAHAHIGIIGYPNTGKSTIINILAGKKAAGTAPTAGFTRGIQKVKFAKNILIIDTPGVFGEKEDVQARTSDLRKQAEIGVRTYDSVKNPDFLVHKLMQEKPGILEKFYNIDAKGDSEYLIETLGKQKGFIIKRNQVNLDKAARYILKDWQAGKIN